jgi:chorismate mutase
MIISRKHVALWFFIVIGGTSTALAQIPTDNFDGLVETSAHRLEIAKQVALAKWDSRSEVEDRAREDNVVASAVNAGNAKGLDRALVTSFFEAQIEASKLVQYALLANWRRAGAAPVHSQLKLSMIRADLDRLQSDLISELADTTMLRARITCASDVAKAAGDYAAIHNPHDPLTAIALDRALAATCMSDRRK